MKIDNRFIRLVERATGSRCVAELRFHPTRKWRFDYAVPARRVAIEVEGGVWTYGRHNRAAGFLKDIEKYNAAAALGWRVLRCTPPTLLKDDFINSVAAACAFAYESMQGEKGSAD